MKKKHLLYIAFFYCFVAIIILTNFFDSNIVITHTKLEHFFDSDLLYFHRLYTDIFSSNHHLLAWHLTPAPYFFPDMSIFFILELLTGRNVYATVLISSTLQYLILIFLSQKISEVIVRGKQAIPLIYSVLLAALIFLVIPEKENYRLALITTYHFGGLLNGLILMLLLAFSFYSQKSKLNLILIGIISLLSTASDPIFVIQFAAPTLLLAFLIKPRLIFKEHCLALSGGVIFGYMLKYIFIININIGYLNFDPSQFFSQLEQIGRTILLKLVKKHPYLGSASLAFYSILFFQCIFRFFSDKKTECVDYLRLFILTSVIITFLSVALFDALFQRYMLNFYFFPLIFCWLPFTSLLTHKMIIKLLPMTLIFLIGTTLYLTIKEAKMARWEYYPSFVQCIDSQINQYNLTHSEKIKYGIASNSQAGAITALSKKGLEVVEMYHNLKPHYWINNPERYRAHYDFAVIALPGNKILTAPENILDKEQLEKINGKPLIKFQCGKEGIIWIYGKNKLNVL